MDIFTFKVALMQTIFKKLLLPISVLLFSVVTLFFATPAEADFDFNTVANVPSTYRHIGIPADMITLDDGSYWYADTQSSRIVKVSAGGNILRTIGRAGSDPGEFEGPVHSIAKDGYGNLYALEGYINCRVHKFDRNGAFIEAWGTCGDGSSELLSEPRGIVYNPVTNTFFIADKAHNRVAQFSMEGVYLSEIGSYGTLQGEFNAPGGIDVDSSGNIYVADIGNNRIQKFAPDGTPLLMFGEAGFDPEDFDIASDVAVLANGNIVATSQNSPGNKVKIFDPSGTLITTWGDGTHFALASNLTVDVDGNIWITDGDRATVQKFDQAGNQLSYFGNSGYVEDKFLFPTDVGYDSLGFMYVLDNGGDNPRIQKFTNGGTFVATVLENSLQAGTFGFEISADDLIYISEPTQLSVYDTAGVFQYATNGGPTPDLHFDNARGIGFSSTGNIYVADLYNDRILIFDESTGNYISNWGVSGTGDGEFEEPTAVFIDDNDIVYVSNGGGTKRRVQMFDLSGNYIAKIGDEYGHDIGQFATPSDIWIDNTQDYLYVVDVWSHRIAVYDTQTLALLGYIGEFGGGNSQFANPSSVTLNPVTGTITISDASNHRVHLMDLGVNIYNLIPSADVIKTTDSESLVTKYYDPTDPGMDMIDSNLTFGSLTVADFQVDLTQERDWNNVNAISIYSDSKIFVSNLNDIDAPGLITDTNLYLPQKAWQDYVYVCPTIADIQDLNPECVDGYYIYDGDPGLTTANINGDNYWMLTNNNASGVMSLASETVQATLSQPTALPDEEVSLTVSLLKDNGEIDKDYRGTLDVTSTGAGYTLPSEIVFTPAEDGTYTATGISYPNYGTYTITVSDPSNPHLETSFNIGILADGDPVYSDFFITSWNTEETGTSDTTSITIPVVGGPYSVDWDDDGLVDEVDLYDEVTHDFGTEGIYSVGIFGLSQIQFNSTGDAQKLLSVDQWGTSQWLNMQNAFAGCVNLQFYTLDTPNFSSVTSMMGMFYDAYVADPDTTDWDTSSVQNMNNMFMNASAAQPNTTYWNTSNVTGMSGMFDNALNADPDVSNWDTSSVTNMSYMFSYASNATPDTTNWDTSSVTDMAGMFSNASIATPNTTNWNTSLVIDMSEMFYQASNANPNVSNWNTSNVIYMYSMFQSALIADPNVSNWDTSSAEDMSYMFYDMNIANPDVTNWDTTNVSGMTSMFQHTNFFNRDLSGWNVSNVYSMENMLDGVTLFQHYYDAMLINWSSVLQTNDVPFHAGFSTYCNGATARADLITNYNWAITDGGEDCIVRDPADAFITVWDTEIIGETDNTTVRIPAIGGPFSIDFNSDNVMDIVDHMGPLTYSFPSSGIYTIHMYDLPHLNFEGMGDSPKLIELQQWGTTQWHEMIGAFYGCTNMVVTATDVPDLTLVTSMNSMFKGAALANPDTTNWNTSNVVSFYDMFLGASAATPNTSNWDTSSAVTMTGMFNGATLATPDTSGWDTSNVMYFTGMFTNAVNANPDVSNWNTSSAVSMQATFANAASATPNVSNWDTTNVTDMLAMFINASSAAPDTSSWNTANVTDMSLMFAGASSANPDTSGWDTTNVTTMENMFRGAVLAQPDVSNWNTANVQIMSSMFRSATIANPNVTNWDTSSLQLANRMFESAPTFDRDISGWDVADVTDFTDFLKNSSISTANYDALLASWSTQALQSNVVFSAGSSTYCNSILQHNSFIADFNWTITDGGTPCSLPVDPEVPVDEEDDDNVVPPIITPPTGEPDIELPVDETPVDPDPVDPDPVDPDPTDPGPDPDGNEDPDNNGEDTEKGGLAGVIESIGQGIAFIVENSTKTVAVIAVGAVAISSFISSSMVPIPLGVQEVVAFAYKGYLSLLYLLGIIVKGDKLGYVYDSVTKNPISLAILRVFDDKGQLIETSVSNSLGKVPLNLPKGNFKLSLSHSSFDFPSRFVTSKIDFPIENIYTGGFLNAGNNQISNLSFPMDPASLSTNAVKLKRGSRGFLELLYKFSRILFAVGLVQTLVTVVQSPSVLAYVILAIYVVILGSYIYKLLKPVGSIVSYRDRPVSGITVFLKKQIDGEAIDKRVTDSNGRYSFTAPQGKYYVDIESEVYSLTRQSVIENHKKRPSQVSTNLNLIRK